MKKAIFGRFSRFLILFNLNRVPNAAFSRRHSINIMRFYLHVALAGVFLLSAITVFGQKKNNSSSAGMLTPGAIERLNASEDTLALLAYAVVNDSVEAERFAACRALITRLVKTLKEPNSFKYPFERLRSVSILAPADSSFRIFTWQLFVNDSTYRYYGAIQLNRQELALFPLIDRSFDYEKAPAGELLKPEHWFGALYYNLREFKTKEGTKYLLFGLDVSSFFERRKIIEVLSFDAAGKPVFGAPVFDMPEATANPPLRISLDYSAEAGVKLNWDEQYQMILMDHLQTIPSPYGRGVTQVPDGSYDGFKLEKGRWKYVNKVFTDVMEEAPRPEPVLDQRKGKTIMGKDKKKGNH